VSQDSFQIGQLQARVTHLENELKAARADIREILDYVSAAKGSWRALVAVGAIATTLGAGVATLISLFKP
jgi:hypothetical protein